MTKISRKALLDWLGTNNKSLSENLIEVLLEVVNGDYDLKLLRSDIQLYSEMTELNKGIM